jgi:hypothetical protein
MMMKAITRQHILGLPVPLLCLMGSLQVWAGGATLDRHRRGAEEAPSVEQLDHQEAATYRELPASKDPLSSKAMLEPPQTVERVLPELEIIPWFVPYTDLRRRLTVTYLEAHHGGEFTGDLVADTTMVPRVVLIHWTGGPTAKSARHTFYSERQPNPSEYRSFNAVNLSAHFVVERDGTVYQLLDETAIGRHVIGMNHLSIGIENVGDRRNLPLTEAQLEANTALIRHLSDRHPITHVLGHFEYREMEGHPYFREQREHFRTIRGDPGEDFMTALRAEIDDLGLQGPPPFPAD